jgi:hypothetical protein
MTGLSLGSGMELIDNITAACWVYPTTSSDAVASKPWPTRKRKA